MWKNTVWSNQSPDFLLIISLLSHFLFLPDGFLLMHEKNSKQ